MRPSERTDSRAGRLLPMVDLTWVTLSWPSSDPLSGAGPQHGGRRDVLDRQTTAGRDLFRPLQALERRIVAWTMLIGLSEPSDLVSTSWMPAHSSTARTGPPAMTPVPGRGRTEQHHTGRRLTLTGCGMVSAIRGTLNMCFLASSTPLAMAAGISLALP